MSQVDQPPPKPTFGAYCGAALKHWAALVTGSLLATGVAIGGGAFGWGLPRWLYAGLFIWLGVVIAGFQAWASLYAAFEKKLASLQAALEKERDKSSRLEREAQTKPRPKLSLVFDPKDPSCIRMHSGSETFSVGIQNDGDVQAEDVRLVLEEIFPANPELTNQRFVYDGSDSFRVSPIRGRPALYVPVLPQMPHAMHGATQTVLTQRARPVRPGASKLILTLRLHAIVEAEPFRLEFEADNRNSLRPKAAGSTSPA